MKVLTSFALVFSFAGTNAVALEMPNTTERFTTVVSGSAGILS